MSDETLTPAPAPAPRREAPAPVVSGNGDLGLVARLSAKARGLKVENKRMADERDKLQAKLDEMTAEREQLRKLADGNAERKKREALEQQIREIKHKEKFRASVIGLGTDPDLVDDLYTLSGYEAKSDEVDDEALGAFVQNLKQSKPKYFGMRGSEAPPEVPAKPEPKPGPASGRGGKGELSINDVSVANQQDPVWVMTPGNQKRAVEAIKAGRLDYSKGMIPRSVNDPDAEHAKALGH